ncbi:pseudouridine synthase [Streptococcus hillyeri]|uniref:Pseudouridine synthase n=1 Tax=Streptococcus hillyeri TaxID=2282420 RepID=A0A3L9DTA7_9STRE|nr:pseudouridine synthase [Streptococcus hillyeri]RLY02889.1 rRNA pseudouridine synthase [Streptococcus hillyeri]
MRLDKFLVDCGIGSRTEVKVFLKKKQITVNGQIETSPKTQVNETTDQIFYQGQRLTHETFVYYLLNKPSGVISATEDNHHHTVLDLLDDTARHKEVFPVGRLDIDTTGLLLLTNNGQLAHAMLSPKKHVDKEYLADVSGVMDQSDILAFEKGIALKDHTCQPATLEILSADDSRQSCRVKITIREGKFHQVKRMVAACGKEVVTLERISMGPLTLPTDLKRGEFRRLTTEELNYLEVFGVAL